MLLREETVVPYLLERRLIDGACVVDDEVEVVCASQRNRSFKFISKSGPCYLLKQGGGADSLDTVAHEAAVYGALSQSPDASGVRRYVPAFLGYDSNERILVLEYVRGSNDLRDYHVRTRRFPVAHAREMGNALALLHSLPVPFVSDTSNPFRADGRPPWVFSLHRPAPGILREVSSANLGLIRIIQQFPELSDSLDVLRKDWRAEALIHSDIKWDNCVVAPGPRRSALLRIVDWELAAVGDPCWDVGSVFHSYLSYWLLSIPAVGGEPPERFLHLARFPLERMQPAIRAFWRSYTRRRCLNPATLEACLIRSIRYGAARLLQTAYEQVRSSMALTGNILFIVQIALNILRRPSEAAFQLLALHAQDSPGPAHG